MDETAAFLFGLFGAILGSIIGGYLNYRGGVLGAQQIAKTQTNRARKKVTYQLHHTLNALRSSDLDKEISADVSLLISVADFEDDESEKIIRFFQRWKDIQFDARKSQGNNRTIAVNLMKRTMKPLVEDIEVIVQKYQ